MKIDLLNSSDQSVKLALAGRLDLQGQQIFETELPAFILKDTKDVILDLSEMDFIASIGMRSFVSLAKKLHEKNGELILCNMQEIVYDTFVTTGLHQILKIVDSCDF